MRTTKANEICLKNFLCLKKIIFVIVCFFSSVLSQCDTGLEPSCLWTHDEKTALFWKMKRDGQESFVELSNCVKDNCGIGIIHSPWLPPRDTKVSAIIHYKIYGTSAVLLRLYMNLDDSDTPSEIFSKNGNYAYGYPKTWSFEKVPIPTAHTRYKLVLKALLPYPNAMVAVRDITLDGTIYLTSSSTTTSSTSTTTISSAPRTAVSSSTSSTTSTTTTSTTTITTTNNPVIEKEEISPTHYGAEIEEFSTNTAEATQSSKNIDYFLEDEEDDDEDEDERRFQALQVDDMMENDLIEGYTIVVEPQLCMYK